MKYRCTVAIVCIINFCCACKKSTPSADNVFVNAHKETVSLPGAELSSDTIHITSNASWEVNIDPSVDWLTIEPVDGTGNADIIIVSTKKNNSTEHRTANVQVKTTTGNSSVVITVIQAQSVDALLKSVFGGEGDDMFSDFVTSPDGGYIAVGHTTSEQGDITNPKGGKDIWIVKFDNEGHKTWSKVYGGASDDIANSVVRLSANKFVVLGSTASTGGDVSVNKGATDAWLLAIDNDGALLWEKTIGGSKNDYLYNLKPGGSGTLLMAGSTESNDGDVSSVQGNFDAWLVKTDSDGNVVWEKTYGGTNLDFAYDATPVSDGGIIFCGGLRSSDGDVADHGSAIQSAWLAKINGAGNLAGQVYVGNAVTDAAYTAIEAANGDYLFAGETNSADGFEGFHANGDAFVCRLDASGNFIWQKAYGGSMPDYARDLIETADGNFIFAGATGSNDGDVTSHTGAEDGWLVKLDGGGNLVNQLLVGGEGDDNITQVKQVTPGNFAFSAQSNNLNDNYPDLNNGITAWFEIVSL